MRGIVPERRMGTDPLSFSIGHELVNREPLRRAP